MNNEKFRHDLASYLQKGITQTRLSAMSGIRQNTISRFVTGRYKSASMDFYLALAPFVYGPNQATPASTPEAEVNHD